MFTNATQSFRACSIAFLPIVVVAWKAGAFDEPACAYEPPANGSQERAQYPSAGRRMFVRGEKPMPRDLLADRFVVFPNETKKKICIQHAM